jgi:small subunit ribosomal protein S9
MAIKQQLIHKKVSRPKKRVSPKKEAPVEEQQVEPVVLVEEKQKPARKETSQFYAVGRRKEAVARVYYYVSPTLEIQVNKLPFEKYFPHHNLQYILQQPLKLANWLKGKWVIRITGGGKRGQVESARLGISRLLVKLDKDQKPILKKSKLLRRDARVKERKKYGLKRARRAPQWQKR